MYVLSSPLCDIINVCKGFRRHRDLKKREVKRTPLYRNPKICPSLNGNISVAKGILLFCCAHGAQSGALLYSRLTHTQQQPSLSTKWPAFKKTKKQNGRKKKMVGWVSLDSTFDWALKKCGKRGRCRVRLGLDGLSSAQFLGQQSLVWGSQRGSGCDGFGVRKGCGCTAGQTASASVWRDGKSGQLCVGSSRDPKLTFLQSSEPASTRRQ